MEYLGESNVFLGLTLAAFATATFIFAPFFGIFEVKFKTIAVICGLAKFSGNLFYSIPVNGYFPLFGRFISGIGEATGGVFYGAVTKCTTNKNRAKAFLYFESLYSIGAIFGPTSGSIFAFNANILGCEINAGNSPGVVLAIVWLLLLILTMFLPSDSAQNVKAEQIDLDSDSDNMINNDDDIIEKKGNTCTASSVCCLYYLNFLHNFYFNMISFYTPLLAVHHLGLGLSYVKLIYLNSSLFAFILYIATYLFLDKISEKKYLFYVALSDIIPISITFYFAVMWNNAITVNAAYFLILMIIVTGQMNFALICSLLPKIIPTNSAPRFTKVLH